MNKINKHLLKVLVVTADRKFYGSTQRLFGEIQGKRCETEWRKSGRTALKAMKAGEHDVCLIDSRLGENTGLNFLHQAILDGCRTPLILLIDEDEEKLRIEAMRTGAACCLIRENLDAPLLEKAIGYAVERVGSLSELRESVNKYRNLVETLPVMVYVAEPRPPYSPIYVSPAFEAFGYGLEEWNSSTDFWVRLIHPQDCELVLSETDAMMRAEKETDLEYRIVDKSGAVHWVHDRGRFVRDEKGKLVCWQGIIIDITERRRVEEESRRREKLYLTLAKNIPHTGVLLFDHDFRYYIAEVSQLRSKHYTREKLEGKTLWEAFPPEISSEWARYYRRALAGEIIDVEIERDGVFFHIYVIPVRNEGGEIYAGMVLCQDITKRKLAEKALRYSEAQFKNAFENAAVGMAISSLDGRWMQVNQQLCRMLGYDKSELLNRRFAEVTHADDVQEDLDSRMSLMSGETRIFQREKRYIHKEGQIVWGFISVSVVRDEYENPSHFISQIQDITERKLAVEALRESEERYREIFENANDLIYVHDLKGNYLSINKATERIIGYTLEEALQLNMRQVIAPEYLDYSRLKLAEKLAGIPQTVYEIDCIAKNGRRVTLEINSNAIYEDGMPVAVQGIARDITERKQTEAALKEREEQYRELFENANDLIFTRDLEGKFTSFNRAGEIITGYTRKEILQMHTKDIIAPDYWKKAQQMSSRIIAGEILPAYELVGLSKQGDRVPFEISMRLIRQNGKPVGIQGIIRDITERKLAEAALREREEQYRELFENANDIIYTRDLSGKFTSLNRAGEILTGYTRQEFLDLHTSQIIAPDHLEKARLMIARENNDDPSPVYELDILSKQGGRIPLELSTRLILRDGKPIGVQGIARDITERKRTEMFLQESEAKLKDLFDNAPTGYHELDRAGRIVRINRTELEMLGYRAEEVLGRYAWEFVVESTSRESVLKKISGLKPLLPMERTLRRKDGSFVSVMLKDTLIKDENGAITGIRANVQDITEQKRTEQALKDSEQKYRLLGEGIMHQIWTAKPDGKLDYVNWRTLEYFGRTYSETLGDGWQSLVHPDDLGQSVENWTHSLKTGEDYLTEFRLRRHDGEYFWFQARAAAGRDAEGNIISWFGTNTDINDQKTAEAKLQHIAGHDTLTNLPNRAKFMNHLERAVRRSEHNKAFRFAVLFLDLDRFKIINDSLGHSIGDKLLVEIAGRLEECLRPNDIVARLGGDEFTVLLTRINKPEDAVRVANRFLERLSEPFNLGSYEVFTSASIGIIVSDEVKRQPEDFLRDADTAMYRAKTAGKSRYEIFDREMHIRNMNLLQMENDLRRAIERNEFRVFYQPIVELDTGKVLEFEALIRWQHPQHGMVPPNDFIGIAEETGLIIPIGLWILEEACRQTAEWQARFPNHKRLSISVNLSAKQLLHPNLIAQIKDVLTRTAFEPRCLKLEVTESMVMENGDKSLAVINDFHALGTSVSTDDFGTGYSSLSYLHQFPFDRLKIDRSFVGKMEKDVKSEAIVRTILLLGQNLEIETVAEGIENAHQLSQLRSLGCRLGQGFYFSKPVDAISAEKILEEGLTIDIPAAEKTFNYSKSEKHRFIELDEVQ